MGLFNAYKSLSKANDTLKRLEYTIGRLQTNMDICNYSAARSYCNDAASLVRTFLETVGQSKTAEISMYTFMGRIKYGMAIYRCVIDAYDNIHLE